MFVAFQSNLSATSTAAHTAGNQGPICVRDRTIQSWPHLNLERITLKLRGAQESDCRNRDFSRVALLTIKNYRLLTYIGCYDMKKKASWQHQNEKNGKNLAFPLLPLLPKRELAANNCLFFLFLIHETGFYV
jgi:hypothetical protein